MPSLAELQFIERLHSKKRSQYSTDEILYTTYQNEGNFTICVVTLYSKDAAVPTPVLVGVCKRDPNVDRHDPVRCQEISLARALRSKPFKIYNRIAPPF